MITMVMKISKKGLLHCAKGVLRGTTATVVARHSQIQVQPKLLMLTTCENFQKSNFKLYKFLISQFIQIKISQFIQFKFQFL